MMRYFEMTTLVGIALVGAVLVTGAVLPAKAALAPAPHMIGLPAPRGIHINNGDIGVTLWGPSNRLTFSIGKADVWDRRYLEKAPVVTFAELKEMAKTGDFPPRFYYGTYSAYDFPCPKPVGQLIIGLPGAEAEWTVEGTSPRIPGVVMVTAIRGDQRLDLRAYVHAARNLIVIEGDASRDIKGLWFRLYRHRDTTELGTVFFGKVSKHFEYDYSQDEGNGPMDPPTSDHENDLGWVSQIFPAELTFPEGFRYTFAAMTSVEGVRLESVEGRRGLGTPAYSPRERVEGGNIAIEGIPAHYSPINKARGAAATFHLPPVAGHFQILATVVTSTDTPDTRAQLALARSRLREALPDSPAERFEVHRAATQDPSYPYLTRKPGGYYADIPGCGAMGNASERCCQDSTAWHGDFHFDEQQYVRGYFVGNRIGQLEPYFQLVEKLLPLGQKNAREVYDLPGCMFTIVHYPIRIDSVVHTTVIWEQIMEITALTIKPFWEHYLYTGDEEFLRNRSYPLLREGARFYAAYVTLEEDGYYHVFPTVSPEHWGLTKDFARNKDSQSALSMIKYHLHAAAQAAEILGENKEERENWEHISANMAPYPTYDTPDGPIFVDVLGAPPREYNIPVPLTAIWWGDQITLESPPEIIAIARRTIEQIKAPGRLGNVNHSRALLGGSPYHLQSRGGWDMVKKRGGWIRVFSGRPDNYNASFRNQLAIGAFEVSSTCRNSTVTELTIRSRVGNTCQLVNPWPGQTLVVKEAESSETARLVGEYVRFPTRAGHTYLIEPAAL